MSPPVTRLPSTGPDSIVSYSELYLIMNVEPNKVQIFIMKKELEKEQITKGKQVKTFFEEITDANLT